MALDANGVVKVFKELGKLIYVYNLAAGEATTYKGLASAVIAQSVKGDATDLVAYDSVTRTFSAKLAAAATSLTTLQGQIKTYIDTYLTTILPGRMGVAAGTATAMATELAAQAGPTGESILTTGVFNTFFYGQYGVTVPGVPTDNTILEAWATSPTVV